MATLRELRASRGEYGDAVQNPNGNWESTTDPSYFNARMQAIEERAQENDPFLKITSRYAKERAVMDEESARNKEMTQGEWKDFVSNADRTRSKPYTGPTHFTNVPGTIGKWQGEGVKAKDIGFIAANPEDLETATKAGVGKVEKSVDYKVPPKPVEDDLLSMEMTNGMWPTMLKNMGMEKDYRNVNPAAEAKRVRDEWVAKNPPPTKLDKFGKPTEEYKLYQKDMADIEKDAKEEYRYNQTRAKDAFTELRKWTSDKEHIREAKEAKATAQAKAQAVALDQKVKIMNDYRNFDLSPDQVKKITDSKAGAKIILKKSTRLKPSVLAHLNQVLSNAGLPTVEIGETERPIQEFRSILGYEIPGTRGDTAETAKFPVGYVDSPTAVAPTAPSRQPAYTVGQVVDVPGKGKHKYMGNNQWQPIGQ